MSRQHHWLTTVVTVALLAVGSPARAADQPFPDAAAGWARTGEIRTFDAAHLYEYIDGDAERYVRAGVQAAVTADYSLGGKVDAVADVYTMARPDGAKAVFDGEAAGDATAAAIGDAARTDGQSLVYRKGLYLVRIIAYQAGSDVPKALIALGRAIEQRLGQ
jgi:hypothetical protein